MRIILIRLKHWWQRRTRGFDDSVTWNLNTELAQWLLPRLKRFKELHNGYPSGMMPESWERKLQCMIFALEVRANDDLRHESFFKWINGPEYMDKHWKKLYRRKEEGMLYLAKFIDHLWW